MAELMFSLGILYLMVMAIAVMVGGPKLIGKLNKLIFKFFRKILKLFWEFLNSLFNWIIKNPSLGISIIGVVVIIICLIILF